MDKAQLLKRLDEEWRNLQESYAGLTDAEIMQPGVTGNWSVRDVIAHVTWWEEEALKHLPLILEGGTPPRYSTTYGSIDSFNARMTELRRHLSLTAVLRQRDKIHRRLISYLKSVPDDSFIGETRFRHRLRLDTYSHYALHAGLIRQWRASRSEQS